MNRWTSLILAGAAAGSLATLPARAEAQLSVQVRLVWTWGDDGWRAHRYAAPLGARAPAYPRPAPVILPAPHVSVRVPPGHLPPPGSCRLWYPGRPPGHQPPPRPCGSLFRTPGASGAVILGSPGYYGEADRGGRGWDDRVEYKERPERREGRGRGRRGPPPGRGG